jgi:hypothetical protein
LLPAYEIPDSFRRNKKLQKHPVFEDIPYIWEDLAEKTHLTQKYMLILNYLVI